MPWGKFRGWHVREVPLSYLAWVLEECDNVSPFLERAIRDELAWRLGIDRPQQAPARGIDPSHLKGAVGRWYREQTMRHHPDRGGEPGAMVALNNLNDSIAALIEGLERAAS
jgi:hypothetical protein